VNLTSGLRDLEAAQIVDAIADAAARWSDADFPPRVRAARAIGERLQYAEPVVDYALDKLFGAITRESLRATIAGELGSLEALDGFVSRAGRPDVRYAGFDLVAIVSSDTTIGVAVPPLVFAACAKSRIAVKDRSDLLVAAFVETLAEERSEFGAAIAAENWGGHEDPEAGAHLSNADVVVAFGGAEALRAIRARCKPDARFVPFGHRTSAGYVARETLNDEQATRDCAFAAARDALLYDGGGCLSLHTLFVENDGRCSVSSFRRCLIDALDAEAVTFPSAFERLTPAAAAIRDAANFRQSQGSGSSYTGRASPHLLLFDPPLEEPPPLTPRTLAMYGVDGPGDALAFIGRHELPLEALAVCGAERPDVLEMAAATGAARIARLGQLQAPPLTAEHGGFGRILPFVRAISRER